MANRVSVEINANVTGFQQGMEQASQSAQQYQTDMRKISDSTINFNKELRNAKREAQNLAGSYAKLDAAAKNSAFGKEMKRQLDEAKNKAAEFIDMQGDLQQELRNMASDTRTLDTLSEGFGVIADSASTALGVIAQFTGNEEDAKRAVVAFTTAQSALGAVTKIQNALQMQSNTMLAVTKVQTLAAAAAARIKTAAEGQGIVVTKAATVAQAAFNSVALANPYVLLAAAIAGVCLAVGAYVLATQDAETETDRQNRKLEEAKKQWNEYKQKVAESAASQVADFIALQKEWEALKTTEEKNKFLDDNKNKFKAMGLEIDDVNKLEELFVRNSAAVITALKARAEAEAWGEIYKEQLKKKLANDANPSVGNNRFYVRAHAGDQISDEEARRANINNIVAYHGQTATTSNMSGTYRRAITEEEAARVNALRMADAQKKLAEENAVLTKLLNKWTESLREANSAYGQLSTTLTHSSTKGGSGGGGSTSYTEHELTELEKLEQKVKEIEKMRADIKIDSPNAEQIIKETDAALREAKDAVIKYKIAVGIEVEPSELDKLEADLKEKELLLRADISQEEKDKVYQEILELRDKIEKEKIAAHIIIDPQIEIDNHVRQAIKDITESINVQEKPKWDFSNIAEVDPSQAKALEKLVQQYHLVYDARERLMQLMNEGDASDTQIAEAQKALEEMGPLYDGILDRLNSFQDVDDAVGNSIKKMKKLQSTVNQVGEAIQSCADLFSALGEAGNDEGFAVMGIVAKAVATVALSYAQALASTKTWVDWLAFGVTGLATMVSMISSIKQATAGYAGGGVIGGSSYSGDRLYARVNSGEMILNNRQQRNLFNLLDSDVMPQKGGTNVQVTGVIHGTDLLLVQKNTSKVMKRAGNKIMII